MRMRLSRRAVSGTAVLGLIGASAAIAPGVFAAKPPATTISVVQFAPNNTALTAKEGMPGGALAFVINRANSAGTATFNVSPFDGSALVNSDYVPLWSNPVTISPGSTSTTLLLGIVNDTVAEPTETMSMSLTSASAVTQIGKKNTAVVTILDNDPCPAVNVSDASATEGTPPPPTGNPVTFTVSTVGAATCALPIQVHWATAPTSTGGGVDATAGTDYVSNSGNVAIPAGATSTTFNVMTVPDSLYELDQTFNVLLSAPVNTSIADGTGVGTINNDDAAPTLSVNDVTDWEGNTLGFTVTRTGTTEVPATFNWTTASDGTASATAIGDSNNVCGANSNDYVSTSAVGASIAAGGPTGTTTLNVTTCQDSTAESNETFTVHLSTPGNASIADGIGGGTIKDDDPASLSAGPQGGFVGVADTVTYTAIVRNTAGDELKGALVRFEAYGTDGAEYDSSGFFAFQQVDLTGPGLAGFDATGDGIDVNSNPVSESDGEATLTLPATGAAYDDIVLACVVPSVAATPVCAGATDHNDDADGNPTTGHNVTIDNTAFTPLEDWGFVFIS